MVRMRKGRAEDKMRRGRKETRLHSSLTKVGHYESPLECCRRENEDEYSPEASISLLLQQMDEVHMPIQEQESNFEGWLFLYLIIHLLLQNFNIYYFVRLSLSSLRGRR